jgi:hypothetical protein
LTSRTPGHRIRETKSAKNFSEGRLNVFAVTTFFLEEIFISNQEEKIRIGKLLSENPSLVTAVITTITTVVLVIITWRYLKETKRMRLIAYRSLQVDASPKVFLSTIRSAYDTNPAERQLIIEPTCYIRNVGKTEAKRIVASYKILFDDETQSEKTIKPAPHIFPTQTVSFTPGKLRIVLDEQLIAQASETIAQKKKVLFPSNFRPKVLMNLTIKYLDHNEEEQKISYLAEYLWDEGSWGMTIAEEETERPEPLQT